MSIDEMSDQEKSVMLARLCGWHVIETFDADMKVRCLSDGKDEIGYAIPEKHCYEASDSWVFSSCLPNLYHPANMALAWRVLNWAWLNLEINDGIMRWWDETGRNLSRAYLPACDPARAQRLWLDKILSLAIDAGMVGETAVTHEPK